LKFPSAFANFIICFGYFSCIKLPEALTSDKQAAKAFFGKFGTIKRFILRPTRNECTVEYETVDAAQAALNYQGNFQIFQTPIKAPTPEPDFIDPDVQSELDVMLPVGGRSQTKQGKKTRGKKQ
jgi:RNA recognition motif. (a.k.a. RRM, RBD, or RNP domain)